VRAISRCIGASAVLVAGAPQDMLDAAYILALYGVDAVLQSVDGWPRSWIAVRPGC